MKYIKNNYFILTGAMGGGKSTIIKEIRKKNYLCIDEPARQIIEEQRSIDGEGIYDRNPELFIQLMLSRSISNYKSNLDYNGLVFFDRGIPDMIAYSELSKNNKKVCVNASNVYQYNKNVFMLSGWKEIYVTDDERKMEFASAEKFGVRVSDIYKGLGYNIVNVPFGTLEKRVEFIVNSVDTFN
ncbi:MAG: AAA family ATPase [Ignavibacteria bacterium]